MKYYYTILTILLIASWSSSIVFLTIGIPFLRNIYGQTILFSHIIWVQGRYKGRRVADSPKRKAPKRLQPKPLKS